MLIHDPVYPPTRTCQILETFNVPDELFAVSPVLHSVVLNQRLELLEDEVTTSEPIAFPVKDVDVQLRFRQPCPLEQ